MSLQHTSGEVMKNKPGDVLAVRLVRAAGDHGAQSQGEKL